MVLLTWVTPFFFLHQNVHGRDRGTFGMFPVRCYTCNASIGQKHAAYRVKARDGCPLPEVFRELDLQRMCCRRMFLGHIDLVEDQMRYPNKDCALDDGGTVLKMHAPHVRVVSCD